MQEPYPLEDFQMFGTSVVAHIPPKKDRAVNNYAFIRFLKVKDTKFLMYNLNKENNKKRIWKSFGMSYGIMKSIYIPIPLTEHCELWRDCL